MSLSPSLALGMTTRDSKNSGTNSSIVLIVNVNGIDTMQYTFRDTPQDDLGEGQANLYFISAGDIGLDVTTLASTYFRIGIRGSDSWQPENIFLFGTLGKTSAITPLGMGVNLTTTGIERSNHSGGTISFDQPEPIVLSTDDSKGDLSFPLLPIALGDDATPIKRLLLLLTTSKKSGAGTYAKVNLQIANAEGLVVDQTLLDTSQQDLQKGQANWYFIPVLDPFIKRELDPARAILLTIEGTDGWLPDSFFLFGLDTDSGTPNSVVPLIHIWSWDLGVLSTDPSEGSASVIIPLTLP
jgi:hypothetical protein